MLNYPAMVLGALMLSMCTTTYGVTCPEIVAYDADFQRRVSAELAGAGPEIQKMVSDYGGLRDAVRACERRRTPER